MKQYYLAYGSNLNLKQMSFRCPTAKPIGTIECDGYKLVYRGKRNGYAYLTIEPCEESTIPMGLFELTEKDIKKLDSYEGYPDYYYKDYIQVKINGEDIKALIYIMNPNFAYHYPSPRYIKTCLEGYKDFGFDRTILDQAYKDTYNNMTEEKPKKRRR